MNINCNKDLLLNAISLLTQIISQKPQSRPILANVHFKTSQNNLTLKATDLELGLHLNVPLMNCYEEGEILLPAYQLLGILRESNTDAIRLEVLEKTAIINGENFQYKLPAFSNQDFPEVPLLEGNSIKLESKVLLRLVKEVSFAMNKDKNRYSLNSLMICLYDDKIESVATDQIRLAFSNADLAEPVQEESIFIFPSKSIQVLSSILSDEKNETVELIKGENQVTVKFKDGFFITRLVDTQFPPYRKAYENYKDTPDIILNTEEFSHAIRQVILLTCENAKNIALIAEKGKITFKASTPLGEGKVELTTDYDGEDTAIGMNPYFVQDFLKEVHSQDLKDIRLKIAGPKKPVILSPHDKYLYFMSPTAV